MGVRSVVALALVASALLGFTVAVPQDSHLGVQGSAFRFSGKGANVADASTVHPGDGDLGSALDRIDGRGLDPDLLKNLDRAALADLLSKLTPEQLAALGLDADQAAGIMAALRDPQLKVAALATLVGDLADRGLSFLNANGDGRFTGGEAAFADLDGDGKVSAGDVRLGILALLVSQDAGLDPAARSLLEHIRGAGGVGLQAPDAAPSGDAAPWTAPWSPAADFPTDRSGGPLATTCIQVYSLSLTCHQRTFVEGSVVRQGDFYSFQSDPAATRTPVALEPDAPGPRSIGTLSLRLDPVLWTPVPALTPNDHLVSFDGSVDLSRDANGMLWARGPNGTTELTLTWAVDLAYYDLDVPGSATAQDVPAAMRPALDASTQAIGLRIADLAGASGRGYGEALRALATYAHGFGTGLLPDRDQRSDDLLAIAEAQVGCARQRAEVFVVAAQSLGIPAHLVQNEAHAFAEAWVPQQGWRLVDLGGCGEYRVAALPGHQEILAMQDLPFAYGQQPSSQSATGEAVPTSIDITQSPSRLSPNGPFTVAGTVGSPGGSVPDGIPITLTYNRTKASPGTAFCATQTSGGGYRATCELHGAPGGSLQLVARLAPAAVAGHPSQASYSDPPFTLEKSSRLDIAGPTHPPAGTPAAYLVRMTDEDGLPVAYAPVALGVDADAGSVQSTDRDGRALFTVQVPPGGHALQARFEGDDGHAPSNATLAVRSSPGHLAGSVDVGALAAGTLRVSGHADAGLLRASWQSGNGSAQTKGIATAGDGSFTVQFDGTPPAGLGLVTLERPADGTGLGVGFSRTVTATAGLAAARTWATGSAVPLAIHLRDSPIELPLTVLVDGQATAQVTARPDEVATVLLDLPAGDHDLSVHAEPGVSLATVGVPVHVAMAEVRLDPLGVLSPGTHLDVAGTLLYDGKPLAGPVTLGLLDQHAKASSGGDGRFRLALDLPASLPVGHATLLLGAPTIGLQQEVPLRLQRAARLDIEAPSISLHAFGTTPVTVTGEGTVQVRVGGVPMPPGLDGVASKTWLVRTLRIDAVAIPAADGLAPATASREVLVVNPLTTLGVPLLGVVASTSAVRFGRTARAARARRERFLPLPQRIKARLEEPLLPPPVPRVVDPDLDPTILLRTRRKGGWTVRDGRGVPVAATIDGRDVRIPVAGLPLGLHLLRLERGRHLVTVPVAVQPLRAALDDAAHRLLARLDGLEGALTMEGLEAALRAHGVPLEQAQAVRRCAEAGLYAGPRCDRPTFHAFFEALDQAQAAA